MFRGAFVRLVHAECLHAAGDINGARSAIATARDRILANAVKIGDEHYRKTFLESVPENARTLSLARQWLGEERSALSPNEFLPPAGSPGIRLRPRLELSRGRGESSAVVFVGGDVGK